jgi:hypothetical protein
MSSLGELVLGELNINGQISPARWELRRGKKTKKVRKALRKSEGGQT